ncbi:uncharacterized protein [Chelonus insularis]|uniref:uncharacterized protein n=1 Tax=Chelonus insularis TaxID=460826 RepID=UPI00158DEE1B|nr:uncharacterized protein LOC118067552 [Chelonus insularis]
MQVSNVLFSIFISIIPIIISSSEVLNTAEQHYDPNSIEQNEKLVRLFLRLAYQTTNRVVELRNAERAQATNKLDTELQNLTLKEIIQGQTKPDEHKNDVFTEVQSRFLFPIGSKTISDILKPAESITTATNHLGSLTSNESESNMNMDSMFSEGARNLLNLGINKTIDAVVDQTNLQKTVESFTSLVTNEKPADVQANVENSLPALRFLSDVEIKNETGLNNSTDVTRIQVNTGKDELLMNDTTKNGNIPLRTPTNNLDFGDEALRQLQALQNLNLGKPASVPDRSPDGRSRRNVKELDAAPCKDKSLDNIFKFSFDKNDDNHGSNFDELITKMKLQDIMNLINRHR